MDAAIYDLLSVTQYIALDVYMGRLKCEDSSEINHPLLLEYYEAKIQMLSVLSWKPALEMPRYVKIQVFQISYF